MTTTNEYQVIVLQKQKELAIAQANLKAAQIDDQITTLQNGQTP